METKRRIINTVHVLEIFMPYRKDEKKLLQVVNQIADFDFYKGMELALFFDKYNKTYIRNFLERNGIRGATFATPYIKEAKGCLCSVDVSVRERSVAYMKDLVKVAAENGYTCFAVTSGDDPGDVLRREAKKALADSVGQLADTCKENGLVLALEPLDRYAYKKQLIGPMKESSMWFAPIHAEHPNAYMHWDSAHEALSKTNLMLSLECAQPYLLQIHLCNAILDTADLCFGDLHMDVGSAPDFKTDGFLTPELGAKILSKAVSMKAPENVDYLTVSIEVLGHPGDDLWLKEKNSREFLQKCLQLAGLDK